MKKEEQKEFIEVLINNVKLDILSKLDEFPDDWDGVELRWFIAERFAGVVWGGWEDKRKSRYKRYDNYRRTKNI